MFIATVGNAVEPFPIIPISNSQKRSFAAPAAYLSRDVIQRPVADTDSRP